MRVCADSIWDICTPRPLEGVSIYKKRLPLYKRPVFRGWICLVIGVIMTMPGVLGPGLPFVIVGLLYLSERYPRARLLALWVVRALERMANWGKRQLARLCNRFPRLNSWLLEWQRRKLIRARSGQPTRSERFRAWAQRRVPRLYRAGQRFWDELQIGVMWTDFMKEYHHQKQQAPPGQEQPPRKITGSVTKEQAKEGSGGAAP